MEDEKKYHYKNLLLGILEFGFGLAFELTEGGILDSLSLGLVEFIPGPELVSSYGIVKFAELLGVEIKQEYRKWGYICSVIPVVKDFINPVVIDGAMRIYESGRFIFFKNSR